MILLQKTKTFTDTSFTAVIARIGQAFSSYFQGSIDLNETYIKVNGVPWFGPGVTKNLVPDGTVVGDVTVKDGIASGFSADAYIKSTMPLPLANENIDIEIAINADTIFNNAQQRVFFGGGLYIRCLGTDPSWNIYFGEEASPVSMGSVSTYPYIKIIRTSGMWYCYRSSNGSSYGQVGTPTAGNNLSDSVINFGGGSSLSWAGNINLNNTYIKVGSDYFYRGMVPQVKTCSIVGATGTADLTQEDKNIILNKGWSLTVQ